MNRLRPASTAAALGAALSMLACGCAVGPDFSRPEPPRIGGYTARADPTATPAVDGEAQRFSHAGGKAADWWKLFRSPQLDAVMDRAFDGNPGLQAAQASLRRSQAELRAGYGVFWPQAAANAGAQRQRYSPQRVGQDLPPSIFNLFTLSASVSYVLDVFGGERRAVEGLQAGVDQQRGNLDATYLALTANVVNTVVAAAAYRNQIDVTQEMIGDLREQVRLAGLQAQAGTAGYAAVLSLDSQLSGVEATLPPLQQKLDQADDLLAILTGRAPGQWQAPALRLADLSLPGDIPLSLPSELVARRPDILVAEAQLHAASAGIGVATAAMLPSLSLDASYGAGSTDISSLFKSQNREWAIGANLTTPLFEGGTLWFNRKAAVEAYRQSLAGYQQAVLAAFGQVADSLHALQHDADALRAQKAQLDAAREAQRLIRVNYQAGVAGYAQLLLANVQRSQAELAYLQTRALRLQDTVALFAALGGDWSDAPAPAAVAPRSTGVALAGP